MIIKTIIDKDGKIIEEQVVFIDGQPIDFEMKDGYTAVDDVLNNSLSVTNGIQHPCLKPVWDGEKWVETATVEELEKVYPPFEKEISQLDIIEAQVTYTAMMTDTLLEV